MVCLMSLIWFYCWEFVYLFFLVSSGKGTQTSASCSSQATGYCFKIMLIIIIIINNTKLSSLFRGLSEILRETIYYSCLMRLSMI